ncbi:MAG: class I SAM-dependent RNA methyltransferase [Verrucomicrobia bacterium]|nr:class I SAM-dependent RNA methyltransferase [Verrucomicrobiota bacterium]
MDEPISSTESLSIGSKLAVVIHDIAFGGEGVARIEDFVIFIPFVALGEEVEVEIVEKKKRFARAKLIRVIAPSTDRVTPECRYFGECGGCQYQHIDYEAQLRIKWKQVADLFTRIGRESQAVIEPVAPCPRPYGYRNRIMIRSQWDKFKQGLNIGFIRADNRLVVDVEECKIAEPGLQQEILRVRNHPPPKGGIKITIRVPPDDWELPPDSFFQNNFHLLPALVDTVRQAVLRSGIRFLIDAYCGVGFFSVELADLVERFAGVELDLRAIQAARKNAKRRNRSNGEYLAGRTEDLLPNLLSGFPSRQTAVILDPPRKGCDAEIIKVLREVRPTQLIYVSCHPATLARDIALLCAGGVFRLDRVKPLDMFPQTQHVECVADLRLSEELGDLN